MSDKENLKPLTPRQQKFLDEYVKHFNAKKAYSLAYGASESTCETNGSKLLHNAKFKPHLTRALRLREEQVKLDATYVVEYAKGVAELDLSELATIGSMGITIKDFKKIPRNLRKYITEVNATETKSGRVVVNFKVFSKEKALDMLAKHTGATTERLEVKAEVEYKSITDLVRKHSE